MDEELRALERAAGQGDADAKAKLERARARAGVQETASQAATRAYELVHARRALEKTFEKDGLADFQAYTAALFAKEAGLHAVRIRGYTPGFLDGDLCSHSQSVALKAGSDDDGGDDDEDEGKADPLAKNALEDPTAQAIGAGLGEFEPVLEAAHGTNWQLLLTRGPSAPKSKKSSWEPGY